MSQWLLLAFIPPVLLALVNHLDKYLITRFVKGGSIGSLILFSSLMGIPTLLLIALFNPLVFSVHPINALLLTVNGCVFLLSILPYLYALELDEASIVSPLSQMTTVISYILGFIFLKESLQLNHFVSFLLIIIGAIGLTLEIKRGQSVRIKKNVLFMMGIASFFYALNGLIFKLISVDETFWTTAFWEYIGFALFAFVLYNFIPSYKKQFLHVLKKNRLEILTLNVLNEIFAITAKTCLHLATLMAPLALVYLVTDGFQPFFVLAFGIIITVFFPKIAQENIDRASLAQKFISIFIMGIGLIFLM